ncbi:hypothetical protein EPUL_001569 [Erysiphe pulchra]|uniref:Uncharacterized protein n=1 Tax=Erysiphe pulchra TaxID=225359 RepID=A0A2S4Q0P0_9PEZI|nr:hypothetical protein EPUL_001569 [Erysiphe pulchra]
MADGHHIKCKRVDKSVPHIDQSEGNNYECGHELFTHQTVKFTADQAMLRMNKNFKYPRPFQGNLYDSELGYWMIPVIRNERIGDQLRRRSTYNVVIASTGGVVDVIAELTDGNFMKCTKTTRRPEEFLKADLRVGYLCGTEFFDINHLKSTAKLAKAGHSSKTYPKLYHDENYAEAKWIFPLFPNGRFFAKSRMYGKYVLVMDKSFGIIFAAMHSLDTIKPCEETLRGLDTAPPELGDFICHLTEFPNKHLIDTVEVGCKALGNLRRKFPARYEGPLFNVHGPYFTWPLIPDKFFKKSNC